MKNFFLILAFIAISSWGRDFDYRDRTELSSTDYLFKQQANKSDDVFNRYQMVDLGLKLGVASDCGRIDFKNTLQGALKNLLNAKYFGSIGRNILAGSPMLLTCYLSPTWCSILKHTRINANFLSQMRLDQCALIDRYVDHRAEDFKRERQSCIHSAIQSNRGNMEKAMESCKGGGNYSIDLANWAGERFGTKVKENRLLESSAKWANLRGKSAKRTMELLKALVGDTVVGRGQIAVDYGPRNRAISPKMRLYEIEEETYESLCLKLLKRARGSVKDKDLEKIGGEIDAQTVRYLSYMPYIKRGHYCRKLAASIALTKFAGEMGQSLDTLGILEQNPNLPTARKQEIAKKMHKLKDSIDTTLQLQKVKNVPVNTVVAQITQEGQKYEGWNTQRRLGIEADRINVQRTLRDFFDCSDGILCDYSEKVD